MKCAFLLFLIVIQTLTKITLSFSPESGGMENLPIMLPNSFILEYDNSTNSNENEYQTSIDQLVNKMFIAVNELYQKTLTDVKDQINNTCFESLAKTNLDEGFIYLLKFYEATNFFNNDLNTYKKCHDVDEKMLNFVKNIRNETISISQEELKGNLVYLLLYADILPEFNIIDIRSKTNTNILGVCIRKHCSDEDYRKFLYEFNNNTGAFVFNITKKTNHTYDCFKNSTKLIVIHPQESNFLELIPIVIMGLIILLTFFPCVLKLCFCCFIKAPKRKLTANLRCTQQSIRTGSPSANNTPSKKSNDNIKTPAGNLIQDITIESDEMMNTKFPDNKNANKINPDLEKNNSINENNNNDNQKINNNHTKSNKDLIGNKMIIIEEKRDKDFNLDDLDNTQVYENEESECEEGEEYEEENIDDFDYDNGNTYRTKFRSKKSKSSFISESQIDYNSIENLIKKLWVRNNFLNFFKTENSSNNKNEIGLGAVKGIRGISLILGISGFVYIQIFSSPFKIYNMQSHENMIKYFYISWIAYGLRFTRRVLYAFSGYTLVYKFLYYLDNVIEKRKVSNVSANKGDNDNNNNNTHKINDFDNSNVNSHYNNNQNLKNNDIKNNNFESPSKSKTKNKDTFNRSESRKIYSSSFTFTDSDYDDSNSDSEYSLEASEESDEEGQQTFSTTVSEDLKRNLHLSDYFRFVLSQSHKLVLTFLFILFFRFSYFNLKGAFYDPKPLFYKLHKLFQDISLEQIIGMLTLWPFADNVYFILGLNEIRFFIVYSFVIFLGYKYRYRIDLFLLFALVVGFLYKIIYFAFKNENMYPALFHYQDGEVYPNFYVDIFFNNSFFIIGILFGKVNYLIQKGIKSKEKLVKKGKDFLRFPLNLAIFFNRMKEKNFVCIKSFWISFSFILNLFFISSYSVFYNVLGYDMKKDYLREMNDNYYLKIFYLIDSEFFLFFLMFNFMLVTNPGKNVLNNFLSHENWRFFSKPYFSIVTILPLILLDFLHHANYRIRIDIFNMTFYSIIACTMTLCFSICCYILFESPMKNFVKFLIRRVK